MGQIISIILNFIFPKAETVVPAQNQPNLAVIDDEEPLLTENPVETNPIETKPVETNPVETNLEESFKTTSSEHPSSDSNLSFQAPLEGPNPDHFSFDPKNYEDVAKVLHSMEKRKKSGQKLKKKFSWVFQVRNTKKRHFTFWRFWPQKPKKKFF